MKVVSFYTSETEAAAKELRTSVESLGLVADIEERYIQGYQSQRHAIPSWLLWKLTQGDGEALLWVNATGRLRSRPIPIENVDMAVFKAGDQYWAKTLYVRDTPATHYTLRRWADLNEEKPEAISCANLKQAIEDIQPVLHILSPVYSWVSETFESQYGKQIPVITHTLGGA